MLALPPLQESTWSRARSRDVLLYSFKSNGRRVSVHWFAGVLQSLCSSSQVARMTSASNVDPKIQIKRRPTGWRRRGRRRQMLQASSTPFQSSCGNVGYNRLGGIHGGKKNTPDDSGLLFRAPFPALWSAPAPAQAQVREYRRGSGPFRGCRLVSNRADALSCRSFLQ